MIQENVSKERKFNPLVSLFNIQATNDPNINLIRDAIAFFNNEFNVMDYYGVHKVISAAGLCVIEKYRNRGIATKMLMARAPLLRCLGVKVTSTIFTTIGSQKAAKAAGYDENFSISYDELGKKFTKMDFSHVPNGCSCKVMSLKV